MTEDQRIDRLEAKIDGLDEKISALAVAIAKQSQCPAPGKCIELEKRVVRLESTHDGLAQTVADLIRWRAWLTGINLVISTLSLAALTIIGSYIVKNS
jgi:uncharacterized coiled-coil protein SlyX